MTHPHTAASDSSNPPSAAPVRYVIVGITDEMIETARRWSDCLFAMGLEPADDSPLAVQLAHDDANLHGLLTAVLRAASSETRPLRGATPITDDLTLTRKHSGDLILVSSMISDDEGRGEVEVGINELIPLARALVAAHNATHAGGDAREGEE